MNSFVIRNVRIVEPGQRIHQGDVLVLNGKVEAMGYVDPFKASTCPMIEGEGRLLTPGLVDIHTHGIHAFSYEQSADQLRAGARILGRYGVTTILPTIIPRPEPEWCEHLSELTAALDEIDTANIPGFHLEGPFMAVTGAACPKLSGDLRLLDRLLNACQGRAIAMSVSPETPNILPVIRELRQRQVAVFLTHTAATVEDTEAAIEAGATHATHFYDVFGSPPETDAGVRPVGVVETVLGDPMVSVDFIADGVHVHPSAIRATLKAKDYRRVALITDSNIGAGLPAGRYATPWGFPVDVSPDGAARHATEGFLAGSSLTMNRGVANLHKWLDAPSEQIWAMATRTPAWIAGLGGVGNIAFGSTADLVLWDDNFEPIQTWIAGVSTYEKDQSGI